MYMNVHQYIQGDKIYTCEGWRRGSMDRNTYCASPVFIDVKSQALQLMHASSVLWVGRDSRIIGPNWPLALLWAH